MGLPTPLAGLLTSLPAAGNGWTKGEREKFMTTFGAVLDFCFPIVERAAEGGDNGGNGGNGGNETTTPKKGAAA